MKKIKITTTNMETGLIIDSAFETDRTVEQYDDAVKTVIGLEFGSLTIGHSTYPADALRKCLIKITEEPDD